MRDDVSQNEKVYLWTDKPNSRDDWRSTILRVTIFLTLSIDFENINENR